MAATGSVRVEFETRPGGLIAKVTIDNERRLNTLNTPLMERFVQEMERLLPQDKLRAVVLTGAGQRAFIGGADIEEMATLDSIKARRFISKVHACCDVIRRLPVPVIARIEGYALGAGMEVAASCDLRLAATNAVFGMPEVKLGIPSVVEAALLPMLIGWGRTRQLLLLGQSLMAKEAQDWGFIEKVVPPEGLGAALDDWIETLLACGPQAIRLQKRLIRDWEALPPRAAVQAGIDTFAEAWRSDEPRRMMRDFLAAKLSRKRGDEKPG
jgi:enoyl-CoA hydratase